MNTLELIIENARLIKSGNPRTAHAAEERQARIVKTLPHGNADTEIAAVTPKGVIFRVVYAHPDGRTDVYRVTAAPFFLGGATVRVRGGWHEQVRDRLKTEFFEALTKPANLA